MSNTKPKEVAARANELPPLDAKEELAPMAVKQDTPKLNGPHPVQPYSVTEKKRSLSWSFMAKIAGIAIGAFVTIFSTLLASGWINSPAKKTDLEITNTALTLLKDDFADYKKTSNDFRKEVREFIGDFREFRGEVRASAPSAPAPLPNPPRRTSQKKPTGLSRLFN